MPLSSALPNELLLEILALIRSDCQNPLDVFLVSSDFYLLFSQLIYGHLEFKKITQLTRFLDTFGASFIPQPIRKVTVDVYNDLSLGLYTHLRNFFSLCAAAPGAEVDDRGRVVFEGLKFRFHTHARDDSLHTIYEALACVNPRTFTWVGPDPPHHFSAAIVPAALPHVLRALATQTNLTHLTLSHAKFPDNGEVLSLPRFPSLKTLTLSQVIFLQPEIVAGFLMNSGAGCSQLEYIELVDAYQQSIWGPRLRRSNIEAAAHVHVQLGDIGEDGVTQPNRTESILAEVLHKIRRIVVCRGKFERIIGGDRVLRDSILV
ncbi:hypothetical protein P691DRAFT_694929 [Macrolepiota fuliginosa MF-IS2]|uniref:Uncharacterized protein n=1 Tax=Macrolepiota fuliginosa MF-IS2 TaxID=1400762 RepID=A0A9P5XPF9_9AGAR|nr:hypothetical protein P691DRAFT_694929 [Macrolepiota fuliginosa MF-IS2]